MEELKTGPSPSPSFFPCLPPFPVLFFFFRGKEKEEERQKIERCRRPAFFFQFFFFARTTGKKTDFILSSVFFPSLIFLSLAWGMHV